MGTRRFSLYSWMAHLDMAMKILITIVVGAAILAIMRNTIPQLFADLIGKISAEINSITIIP